jgi:hypothetical protein
MYSTVFKSDPLDPISGDRYQPGGSWEELDAPEVKEVTSSIDKETVGIPRTRPKSGCIYGGNIWKLINKKNSGIPRRIDTPINSFRRFSARRK